MNRYATDHDSRVRRAGDGHLIHLPDAPLVAQFGSLLFAFDGRALHVRVRVLR